MKEFRVEKEKVRVTMRLREGFELQGCLFVDAGNDEPTVNKLRTLLNGPSSFVPVEIQDEETVLQNKEAVIWCRYDGPAGPVLEVLLPRRRVTLVLIDGTTVKGDMVANGPEDRRRVLDCLNRADRFLLLETREADVLVRTGAVSIVPSPEEGEPRDNDGEGMFEVETREPEMVAAV